MQELHTVKKCEWVVHKPSFLTLQLFEFNAVSQKQGKKECERSEIDHHLDYHPVLQFLLRSLQVEFDSTCISKSQTFVQKFNFTSFSPKFFLTIFLVKSKLSTAKKSKTTTFSREIKVEFLDKK